MGISFLFALDTPWMDLTIFPWRWHRIRKLSFIFSMRNTNNSSCLVSKTNIFAVLAMEFRYTDEVRIYARWLLIKSDDNNSHFILWSIGFKAYGHEAYCIYCFLLLVLFVSLMNNKWLRSFFSSYDKIFLEKQRVC